MFLEYLFEILEKKSQTETLLNKAGYLATIFETL